MTNLYAELFTRPSSEFQAQPQTEDQLLDLATAGRLACSRDWLRRNADRLGIAIRLGAGELRFSRVAIDPLLGSAVSRRRRGSAPRPDLDRQFVGSFRLRGRRGAR